MTALVLSSTQQLLATHSADSAKRYLCTATFVCVITKAADFKNTASLADNYFGAKLLLQALQKKHSPGYFSTRADPIKLTMPNRDMTIMNIYSTGRYSQKKLPRHLMFITLR